MIMPQASPQPIDPVDGSTYQFGVQTFLDNTEIAQDTRVAQQNVIPAAIKTRLLNDLFTTEPPSFSNALYASYQALPDQVSVSFLFTVSNSNNLQVFPIFEISFYVNHVKYPNSPYGFGATPVFIYNDLAMSNGKNMVVRAAMRNSSGASISLIEAYARFRIITNLSPTSSSTG